MGSPQPTEVQFGPDVALVVVDVQNDFTDPNGSLYVQGGEVIVPRINALMAAARDAGATVVLTQDWHPPETPHFEPEGTWPVHCVGGTWGAELYPELDRHADALVRKGTRGEDGYSAFTMREHASGDDVPTGLGGLLHQRGVEAVVVVGLATDVCVAATASDAAADGFTTIVVWDATRPVEPDAGERVLAELAACGVAVVGAGPR
jgi:nicotinamidase/pyrazinamidase